MKYLENFHSTHFHRHWWLILCASSSSSFPPPKTTLTDCTWRRLNDFPNRYSHSLIPPLWIHFVFFSPPFLQHPETDSRPFTRKTLQLQLTAITDEWQKWRIVRSSNSIWNLMIWNFRNWGRSNVLNHHLRNTHWTDQKKEFILLGSEETIRKQIIKIENQREK